MLEIALVGWMLHRLTLGFVWIGDDYDSISRLLRDPWVVLSIILLVSIVAISDFYRRFLRSIRQAPYLEALAEIPDTLPTISVIIPAYNEAVNIGACMKAVLANRLPDASLLQLIVADDESTDKTKALADSVAQEDERVTVMTVPPRPETLSWRGKNWACTCALEKATGEYLLFIDTDVRVAEDAIARALSEAKKHKSDLLSCAPAIVCGCFSEWIVQPIMANLIAIGFDFEAVNDAARPDVALAAGPFMLFLREAYDKIGGHEAVAADPVEDLALAALIKEQDLSLRYVLGLDVSTVRMYRSFGDLWEGWTKNYYLGADRNALLTVVSAAAVFLIFVMPWLGFFVGIVAVLTKAVAGSLAVALLVLAAVAVSLQVTLRQIAANVIGLPVRYLWLGWLGGAVVSGIAIASMVKVETGWGWTWRGRSLAD